MANLPNDDPNILEIVIPKAGKRIMKVDISKIPDASMRTVYTEGVGPILNKGMSKVGAVTKLEGAELEKAQALAWEIANKNLEALYAGETKKTRSASKDKGVSGAVKNEARRLAREVIRDEIKRRGEKPSHYDPKEITALANELIDSDPSWFAKAKESLIARTKIVPEISLGSLAPSAKALAKVKEKAAERKAPGLSAKQAGIVPPRKPKVDGPTGGHPHHV
jgi:hypothetical protein